MKSINNKNHNYSLILSKVCLGSSISLSDPSNFNSLLGYRESLFSFLNPSSFQYSLKTGFSFVEFFLKHRYNVLFIINLKDSVLLNKFQRICKQKNYFLLKDSEISSGFLTNKKTSNLLIITLFLDHRKTELIQKESLLMNVPLVSFNDLTSNRFSSSIAIAGSYSSLLSRNLVLSLLSVCLKQKFDYKSDAT
jgi:hypothetical protein